MKFFTKHIIAVLFIILTVNAVRPAWSDTAPEGVGVLPFSMSMGYEHWQVNWYVDGFALNAETNTYTGSDYAIDPTPVKGVFVSTASKQRGEDSWSLTVKAYGDYIGKENEKEADSHIKYIRAFLSYGISENSALYSQYQHGVFKGVLAGESAFESEFKKLDLLLCGASPERAGGFGLRFLTYSMPVEYAFVDHETGEDLGHAVYRTETKGVSIMLRSMDPIVFGYDNGKLFFMDYDFAFGISRADAEELKDNLYGFQFNFDVEAGIKKAIRLGDYGLAAVKAGYRVFFDSQILSEWEGSDDMNTTSTLRNYFHGPFVTVMASF